MWRRNNHKLEKREELAQRSATMPAVIAASSARPFAPFPVWIGVAPARERRHSDRPDRFRARTALRQQHTELSQLRDDLFRRRTARATILAPLCSPLVKT